MLVEIQCDKFKTGGKDGEVRPPIHFHAGLNAIVGDDDRSNSIGKSTLLMIIDFVFGGEDYIKKCSDVHSAIKEHVINFTFRFGETEYSFARSTTDYMYVIPCDRTYKALQDQQKLHIDEFKQFLSDMYGIDAEGLTWRGLMSKFIRVFRRDTMDAERPLQQSKDEPVRTSVINYLKQFKRYTPVKAKIDQAQSAEDEKKAFKLSVDRGYIRMAQTDKEYRENEARIAKLEHDETELAKSSDQGLLDLDSIQAQQISELNAQLLSYTRHRARVQTQLNAVRREMTEGKKSFKRSYDDLARFFPNTDFRSIEQIEEFHRGLSKVLADEFHESEQELSATFVMLNNEIMRIKQQIAEIKSIPNVTQAVLRQYAQITTELNNVRQANSNYSSYVQLRKTADEYAEDRDAMITYQVSFIQNTINDKMREITARILKSPEKLPPRLTIEKLGKYTLETKEDGGSGALLRALITFDLANMEVSNIPFIVHDADLMDPIEKPTLTEIVREYSTIANSGRQAFVSFRSYEFYAQEAHPIIRAHQVIQLSANGNELFGWAWNKEQKKGESDGNQEQKKEN